MNPVSDGLALPVLVALFLTLVVWIYLFVQRVRYSMAHRIDIEQFKTPTDAATLIPAAQSTASNNFKNLLEMPLLFYVICFYLTLYGQVDEVHVICAWVFVALRVIHSLIHCTVNRVALRLVAYMASSIAVWLMLARAIMAAL